MSSSQFDVIALIFPKVGKADRIIELLAEISKYVQDSEPGTLRYQAHRSLRPAKDGTEDIVMIETYKDKEAMLAHGSSEKFKAFGKKVADEGLVRAPMQLKLVSPKAGFASRL